MMIRIKEMDINLRICYINVIIVNYEFKALS